MAPAARITSRAARHGLDLAVARAAHAGGAPAVELQAVHERAGDDAQVGPRARRAQVGHRGRAAPSVAVGELEVAGTFLVGAVEVGVARNAGTGACIDEGFAHLVLPQANVGHAERAAGAVIVVARRAPGPPRA